MMDSFWQMKDAQEDDHQYWWDEEPAGRYLSRASLVIPLLAVVYFAVHLVHVWIAL
jgi:hypothetical protein